MRTELEITLADHGFTCSQVCLDKFCQYYELLARWNQKVNLTALTAPRDYIYKHILDSLYPAQLFPFGASTLLDVGAGAGFPGLPLKIFFPEIKLTLVEAVAKKASFLKHCCEELAIEAEVIWDRAENLGQGPQRESFALAITRAVASLPTVCEYCLPLVSIGGHCLAMKGAQGDFEAVEAERALRVLGGKVARIDCYQLPQGDQRSLVIIEKIIPTPTAYPRRAGIPGKRPL